jgi:hypothetical protein
MDNTIVFVFLGGGGNFTFNLGTDELYRIISAHVRWEVNYCVSSGACDVTVLVTFIHSFDHTNRSVESIPGVT